VLFFILRGTLCCVESLVLLVLLVLRVLLHLLHLKADLRNWLRMYVGILFFVFVYMLYIIYM
jgi:hypothetical protein